ncbi:MAG: hypothetical protein KBD78_00610 [Oligoflexales bacterium]|nr:hypothetical protein [Oligoflexales bacterium]
MSVVRVFLCACLFSNLAFSADWVEKFESVDINWTRLKARYVSDPVSMTVAQNETKNQETASDALKSKGVDYPPAEEKAYALGKQYLAEAALRFYEQDLHRRGLTGSSNKINSEIFAKHVYRSRTVYHQSGSVQVEFELDLRNLFLSAAKPIATSDSNGSTSGSGQQLNALKQVPMNSNLKPLVLYGQNLVPVSYFDLVDEFGMLLFSSSQMNVLEPALSAKWVRGARIDSQASKKAENFDANLSLEIIKQNKGSLIVSRSSWIQADPQMLKSFLAQGRVQVNEF